MDFLYPLTRWQRKRRKRKERLARDTAFQQLLDRDGLTPVEVLADVLPGLEPMATGFDLVRIGGARDGGYLLPDDLDGLAASFSPGVNVMVDFDLDMAARGVPVFMADASVDGPPVQNPLFDFEKLFLGPETRPGFITLDDWVAGKAPAQGDLLLQIDIEGAEWDVLDTVSDAVLNRFRIIALEVHDFHEVFRDGAAAQKLRVLKRLGRDFVVAHVHINNCDAPMSLGRLSVPPTFEITYLRRDRVTDLRPAAPLPHPLDTPNDRRNVDFVMPPVWRDFRM
ncbi:FkbM family methyltransferase [Mesobacterium sp. TK19101]|uniref:FkbM family methyltransferase n=1 Tax=Mesobacterium hydrothermale TaxID=3111907 RepID=A0ABU6HGJ2_9RHOB|nr:FkbM family methyltransferase [Mesobacterium sp. TK19101]MEC3860965.1 FkbM family methyltransferase [Mesobacterium sp. TK19101]